MIFYKRYWYLTALVKLNKSSLQQADVAWQSCASPAVAQGAEYNALLQKWQEDKDNALQMAGNTNPTN